MAAGTTAALERKPAWPRSRRAPADASLSPAPGPGGRGGTTAGRDTQNGSTATGAARGGGPLCSQRLQKQPSTVESFLSHDGNLKKKKKPLFCIGLQLTMLRQFRVNVEGSHGFPAPVMYSPVCWVQPAGHLPGAERVSATRVCMLLTQSCPTL